MNAVIDSHRPHPVDPLATAHFSGSESSTDSAVSWAAVFAGAAVAAVMSLILLVLGTGLGMSSVSPWSYEGVSAETFGWTTIAWISFTSLVASGLGGYIAGRLRTRWVSIHGDETYFRDTAHGFLAWSVATLFTVALLTSHIAAIVGMGVKAGAETAAGLAQTTAIASAAGAGAATDGAGENGASGMIDYYIDSMFRPAAGTSGTSSPAPTPESASDTSDSSVTATAGAPQANQTRDFAPLRMEAFRIVGNSLRTGTLSQDDTQYLGRLVAERTAMSPRDAEARVTEVHARLQASLEEASTATKEAADEARKAAAYASLWMFITLLMGAFAASLMATFGGRQRDS